MGNISNNYTVNNCGIIYPLSELEWENMSKDWEEKNNTEWEGYIQNEIKIAGKAINFWVVFFKVPKEENGNYEEEFKSSVEEFQNMFTSTDRRDSILKRAQS